MLKKITTIIATHKNALVRKAAVIGGVTLGIGIGLLLNKVDDPDMLIVEELIPEDSDEAQSVEESDANTED